MLADRRIPEYLRCICPGHRFQLFISTVILYTFLSFPCTASNELLYQVHGYHLSILAGSDVYALVNSPLPNKVSADIKPVARALQSAGIKNSDDLAENIAEQTSEVIQLRWQNNKGRTGLLSVCANSGQLVLKRWSDHPGSESSEDDLCDEYVLDSEQGELLIARTLLQGGHSQLHFQRQEVSMTLNSADDGTLPPLSTTTPVMAAGEPDVFTLTVHHYTEDRAVSGGSDLPRQSGSASTRIRNGGVTIVDPDNPPDDERRSPPEFPLFYFEKLGVLTAISGNNPDKLLADDNPDSQGNVVVLFVLANGSVQSVSLNKTIYQAIQASHHSRAFWSQLLQGKLSQMAATGFIVNALDDLYQPFVAEGQKAAASAWSSLSMLVEAVLPVPVHIDQGSPESLLRTKLFGHSDYGQYLRQAGGGTPGGSKTTSTTTTSTTTTTTTTAGTPTTSAATTTTTTTSRLKVASGEPPRRNPSSGRGKPDGATAAAVSTDPVQKLNDGNVWSLALQRSHPDFVKMLKPDVAAPAFREQHILADHEIYILTQALFSPLHRVNNLVQWLPTKGKGWWNKVIAALHNSGHHELAESFKQKAIDIAREKAINLTEMQKRWK